MLEVALTRLFSFVTWYHMTYLVVSLALLGYGAAGTYLAIRTRIANDDYGRTIGWSCGLFYSLLAVVSVAASVRVPLRAEGFFEGHYKLIGLIVLTHIILAVPFFFAGTAVGFVLTRNRRQTNRLYSADLLGAGAGSLLAVILINRLGTIPAIFIAATLPALVAVAALPQKPPGAPSCVRSNSDFVDRGDGPQLQARSYSSQDYPRKRASIGESDFHEMEHPQSH